MSNQLQCRENRNYCLCLSRHLLQLARRRIVKTRKKYGSLWPFVAAISSKQNVRAKATAKNMQWDNEAILRHVIIQDGAAQVLDYKTLAFCFLHTATVWRKENSTDDHFTIGQFKSNMQNGGVVASNMLRLGELRHSVAAKKALCLVVNGLKLCFVLIISIINHRLQVSSAGRLLKHEHFFSSLSESQEC